MTTIAPIASIDDQHTALARAEAICAKRGVRLTAQRKEVLRLIWTSRQPVKAYSLLTELQKADSKAKPPTVYRALDFLLEQGLIHRLDSLNAFTGCIHPDAHDNCYFLICRDCGVVSECCSGVLESAIDEVSGKHGFTPEHTTLEIAGTCESCSPEG